MDYVATILTGNSVLGQKNYYKLLVLTFQHSTTHSRFKLWVQYEVGYYCTGGNVAQSYNCAQKSCLLPVPSPLCYIKVIHDCFK